MLNILNYMIMKKKFLLSIMAFLPMALMANLVEISGYCGKDGDNIRWTYNSESGSLILEGTGEMASCNSGKPWDKYVDDVSSITVGEGITSVSDFAFQSVKATKVTLPSTLKRIDNNAFMYCINLEKIVIPNSVESLGNSSFEQCLNLKDITLSISLTEIPNDAFRETVITSLNIPNGIKRIGNRAFYSCKELKEVTFPDDMQEIGNSSFNYCNKIEELTVPKNVTRICNSAFKDCGSLQKVTIAGTPIIDNWAFAWCSKLSTFVFPDSYTDDNLNGNIFDGCESLPALYNSTTFFHFPQTGYESYSIPEGITTIAQYAFYGNQSVKQLILPSTVIKFGDYSFANSIIEELDLSGLDHITLGRGAFSNSSIHSFVSQNKIANYAPMCFDGCKNITTMDISGIRKIEGIIYDGDLGIGEYAFRGCENLKQVILPEDAGKLEIGRGAFINCSSLESFDFTNVRTIDWEAFSNCTSIKNILISDFGKNDIGVYLYPNSFSGCTSLESVTIGSSGIQHLYMSAFKGCDNLGSIVINSQRVPSISDLQGYPNYNLEGKAFSELGFPYDHVIFTMFGYMADECLRGNDQGFWKRVQFNRIYENLSGECGDKGNNITWSLDTKEGILRLNGSGGMKLPEDADVLTWKDRSNAVKKIILADGIESICPYAFEGCAIKAIKLNKNLKSIGAYAFYQCSIESIEFNSSLEFIDNWAFGNCTSLQRVILNEGLKEIGHSIFYWCNALTEAVLPSTLTTIGEAIFGECASLKTVTLPKRIAAIPKYTFSGCKSLKDIYIPSIVPPSVTGYGNDQIRRSNITLHIPYGTSAEYKRSNLWEYYQMDEYYAYVSLKKNHGGVFVIGEETVKDANWDDYLKLGQSFSAEVIPDNYYMNQSVIVNGVETQQDNKLSFESLQENKDVMVTFAPKEYTLSISVLGKGHVSLMGHDVEISGLFNINHENEIEMAFVSDNDSELESVFLNSTNVMEAMIDGKYTIKNPTCNIEIKAFFTVPKLLGDANGDGTVNAADIVEVCNAKAGRYSASFIMANADIDGNGSLTESDVTAIVNIIMGKK